LLFFEKKLKIIANGLWVNKKHFIFAPAMRLWAHFFSEKVHKNQGSKFFKKNNFKNFVW